MKRLFLVLCGAIFLSCVGAVSPLHAQGPQGAGAKEKRHWFSFHWHHRDKHKKEKHDPLHKFPRSIGWWHKQPGPAGAGSGEAAGPK